MNPNFILLSTFIRRFHGDAACIVYDKEDCKIKDWDAPLTFRDGDSKSFSLLRY